MSLYDALPICLRGGDGHLFFLCSNWLAILSGWNRPSPRTPFRVAAHRPICARPEPDRSIARPMANGSTPRRMSRSEEHTSELQSPIGISYAVFCLNKKKTQRNIKTQQI